MTKNQEVAELLYSVADLLELQEVEFKPVAYRRAAQAIEGLNEDIAAVWREDRLMDIAGVGRHISGKIDEFLRTGKLKYLSDLKKKIKINVSELMSIEGLGPKRIKLLYNKLGIRNRKELEAAIRKGRVGEVVGKKVEENILKAIGFAKSQKGRHLLGQIWNDVAELENRIKELKGVRRVDICGSFRRRKESVGDIDVLAIGDSGVCGQFAKLGSSVIAMGNTKASIVYNGIHVDLRVVPEKSYGAALNYFIGGKKHNIHMRRLALAEGYKLNEYGLFKGNRYVLGANEKKIYKKFGMHYIEPELREDNGEIEAAMKGKLPQLVELKDINGDCHVHTGWSDGSGSVLEIARKAESLGYEYVVVSDHTKGLGIARGLDEKMLLKQVREVESVSRKVKNVGVLSGCEVNITAKGLLDIRDSVLKKLDVVIASVHSGFSGDATKRIINAMENENVDIIGHPTGRMIEKREGYELDLDAVFDAVLSSGTCLEVNAQPERLDLPDVDIRRAVERGVKLVVSTDAHSVNGLGRMKFGVFNCRRGWAEKNDILNTLPLNRFLKNLK